MIRIEASFNMNEIHEYIDEQAEIWFASIVEDCKRAAVSFVEKLRNRSEEESWHNRTWNLRSSLGAAIVYRGQVVFTYFPTLNGAELGSVEGEAWARELAAYDADPNQIATIIVAGMDYAIFLENLHNKDVLTKSSQNFPKVLLDEFLKK